MRTSKEQFETMISSLDLELFSMIHSSTTDGDRRSLLAVHNAMRALKSPYVYLEIGSHLGGTIQPYLLDSRCSKIYSIDKRPPKQPDERGADDYYPDNSTERMLNALRELSEENVKKIVCFDHDASDIDRKQITARPDICFIDGEHTDDAVISDFSFSRAVLNESGVIVFHDSNIVFNGLAYIIRGLKKERTRFSAYNLPDHVFVIEFGDCPIHKDDRVSELLVNNYVGYLGGLSTLLPYREFAVEMGNRGDRSLACELEFMQGLMKASRGRLREGASHFSAVVSAVKPVELRIAAEVFADEIASGNAGLKKVIASLGQIPRSASLGFEPRHSFYLRLAKCLSSLGRDAEALGIIKSLEKKSGRFSPDFEIELALQGGRTYQRLGKLQSASNRFRSVIDRALVDDPNAGWARYSLAEMLLSRGEVNAGLTQLREIASAFAEGDLAAAARLKIGSILAGQGSHLEALAHFESVRDARPSIRRLLGEALLNAGLSHKALGQLEKALERLGEAKKYFPAGSEQVRWAKLHTALCLSSFGRDSEAVQIVRRLERLRQLSPKLSLAVTLHSGGMLQKLGRLRAAASRFRKVIDRCSANDATAIWARQSLAAILLLQGKPDEAMRWLDEIIDASAHGEISAAARARIGTILFERQDFEGALGEFKLVAQSKSKDRQLMGWAFFGIAQCSRQLGQRNEAARYFAKSQHLLSDPEMLVSSLWERAHLLHGDRKPEKAVRRFETGVEFLIEEGRCSQEIGFRSVMSLHKARAFELAARLLKSLSKVIDLDRRFWRLALAYKRRGFLTSAEDMMSSLEFLPPSEQAEWHLSAASLLLEMGYDQDAEDEVRSALQLRPVWPQANYLLGSILERRCDLDEAKSRFEAVLDHEESVGKDFWCRIIGGAHYHLACILERSGEGERALQHLESCLEIIPRHGKAMELRESLLCMAAPVSG